MKNLNRHLMKTKNNQTQNLGEKKMKAKKLILGLVALSILSFATSVSADIPQMINYQGVLTDPDGCPVKDSSYSIIFSVYDAPTGGNLMWADTLATVTTTQGNFNVLLGSNNPIPDSLFVEDSLWLAVKVGNDPEMTPRQRIASVGYAFRAATDGDWDFSDDDIYRLEGNVGIGTEDPDFDTKLDVRTPGGTAIKGESEADAGGKFGGEFFANGAGYSNVGVWARAGCYGLCTPASHCNIGIYAKDGSNGTMDEVPPGNWAGYFEGDVSITDSLNVGGSTTIDDDLSVSGTIKLTLDYESEWTHICAGCNTTLTHNLGGSPEKYIVFLTGKSTSGYIHQKNYGTNYRLGWRGCEWDRLTSTSIRVLRGDSDDDLAPDGDWYYFKIRILKNQ